MSEPVLYTPPESRTIRCEECGKNWHYGCAECAELFATYHRNEFEHQVAVLPPRSSYDDLPRLRPRDRWWER